MNFLDLQPTVVELIQAHPTFTGSPVFADIGNVKRFKEAALDLSATEPGPGYCVAVWPPVSGHADAEYAGINGVDARIVVRFEVNPQLLTNTQAIPDAAAWLNERIKDIINAVLSDAPDAGGARFQLAPDAFELTDFDEGLVAYHVRFIRFAVFGAGI